MIKFNRRRHPSFHNRLDVRNWSISVFIYGSIKIISIAVFTNTTWKIPELLQAVFSYQQCHRVIIIGRRIDRRFFLVGRTMLGTISSLIFILRWSRLEPDNSHYMVAKSLHLLLYSSTPSFFLFLSLSLSTWYCTPLWTLSLC